MLLIDYARKDVGLPMGSFFLNQHFGWTTDREKAMLMKEAGAIVTACPSNDPRPDARMFDGWEIIVAPDAERIEEPATV